MSRFFIVFFTMSIFLVSLLEAGVIKEKVENIIGSKDYKIHKSLIDLLFQNESKYMSRNTISYNKLFKTLQEHGLLNLRLDGPSQIEIEFVGLNQNFKSYKILNDTLHSLGYRYFFTKSMSLTAEKQLIWNIALKTEYMLDPVVLLNELRNARCQVTEVTNQNENRWSYTIDFFDAELANATEVPRNEKVGFQKPLNPYMIKISEAKSIQVISRNLNSWFPHIVFFDKDLQVLDSIKKDRISKGLKVAVPKNTRYVKITDMYNLINIKRGLSIIVR